MTNNDKQPESNEKKDAELSIGERIQKKRKELGLSVDELAALTALYNYDNEAESEKGLSSQTLYRYEKNEREPASREIKLLCGSLNVSADWLVFGQLWNAQQEVDSKLASDLRALIENASNTSLVDMLKGQNKTRNDFHEIKLMDIKNRKK